MKNIKENMNNFYELNCLIGLSNGDGIKELAEKIENWIEKKKGELVEVERPETPEKKSSKGQIWVEKRRLAYPVNKDKAGFYLNIWTKLNPSDIKEFKRFLKLEKEIIRFAILADKNIAYPHPNREAVIIDEIGQLAVQQAPTKHPERREVVQSKPVDIKEEKKENQIKPEPVKPETVKEEKIVEVEEKTELVEQVEENPEETKEKPKETEEKQEEIEEKPEKEAGTIEAESEIQEEKVELKEEVNVEIKEASTVEKSEEGVLEAKKEDKKEEEGKKDKSGKHKKITLEELDKRLDDILNEDIL